MVRSFLLAAFMGLSLASCSTVQKLNTLLDKTTISVDSVNGTLKQVENGLGAVGESTKAVRDQLSAVRNAVMMADKNGDKKVSGFSEWKELIILLLGIFGIGGAKVASDAKLRRAKTDIHKRIDRVEGK